MADYSGAYEGHCPGRCSTLSGHNQWCPEFKFYEEEKFAKEHNLTISYVTSDMGNIRDILYYRCNRGCGTLVWDPKVHIENVCRDNNEH